MPECFDRRDLGKEAVAADIKPVPVVLGRPGNPSDDVVGFENRDPDAVLGEQVGGRQPGGTPANDNDVVSVLESIDAAQRRYPL